MLESIIKNSAKSYFFLRCYKQKLPVNPFSILKNLKHKLKHSTSGSSGQPLRVEISGLAEAYRFAGKLRYFIREK